ncbi:MutS-related protein [Sedimentibacter sp. MB31-C6]|uniref:lysine 5,6-aminomutase reactivase ATPase KamC n=1 Tax=Sedimentibacter sp. MB31-C6 TaxID=3109366 RepID=UPI002DDD3420|nr:DNA mismatch repair protein MutS [Sedimentibacter sp. MB36-C1]WSI05409.1 DNA mismatch repair protein MutS [Sedimentibacter sp. MB36-C1]
MKIFMTDNTKKNINFDYIFNEVRPITEYGIKSKLEAKPFKKGQEADLKQEFNKIRAFIETSKRRNVIDILRHTKNIIETIERAKNNQVLDEVELFEVKNFLIQVEKMERILRGILSIEDLKLTLLPHLFELLDPANEKMNTYYIYDEYSDKLRIIRKDKKETDKKIRILKKQIKEEIEKKYNVKLNLKNEVIVNKSQKDKIEALNAEQNLRISGENYLNIIYIIKNNKEIDELEHKLDVLSIDEENEEYKIRQNISKEIKSSYDVFIRNMHIIGRVDYIIAKANYGQKTKSVEPEITSDLEIIIKGGRNLKLEKTLKEKHNEYIPVDLNINKKVICITGANMGGKTVSLRMIGQIVAAASYGMLVPCEYAKICLFDHISISVGDDQSIEKGLSTFGAEIVNLKEALDYSDERSLILIDELAGGTNPKEGYAITKAVINFLKSKDCITVLTTHYDNVANDSDIQNLQVAGLKLPEDTGMITINNIDQISKYMDYRLIEVQYQNFIPKDALRIAKMAGIYDKIIEDAEKYI